MRASSEGSGIAVSTPTGGGSTVWQSSASRPNFPRSVGEVETGCAHIESTLAWPSSPRRGVLSGSSTSPKPSDTGARTT